VKKISETVVQFFSHSSDLPLAEGPASRFVPWIIAFMIYLTCLVTLGMLMIQSSIRQWDTTFSGTLTLEIPYASDVSPSTQAEKIKTLLAFIGETLPVEKTQHIETHKIEELLEPWLGKGNITDDLPLPTLIDVHLKAGPSPNIPHLIQELQQILPGVTIEDHGQWRQMVVRLFKSGEYLGLWFSILIVLSTVITIIFSTHTELTIHRKIVDILQTVGAHDRYVAWQFQRHALHLGVQAATISLCLIGGTFIFLGGIISQINFDLLRNLTFNPWIFLSIPLVIITMILLMVMTARLSVLKALCRP
jgi:cell division transport system permease protein